MNKKICILTSVHSVFDTRIFYKETKTLTNAGYDITLIAQHNKNETVDGVKIVALPKPKNRLERFFKLDYLIYKKALQQKADIYHFHDPELIPWTIILKLRTKSKIIYDIHENVFGQILSKKWINPIFRYIISYIYKFFEKVFCSIFDHNIIAGDDIKIKTKNQTVIKNYPFRNLINFNNIEKDHSKFIYIGAIGDERCIKEIIESLNYLKKSIKLLIIGNYNNKNYAEELKKMAKKQQKHQITFSDQMPYKKVLSFLKSCIAGFILLKPTSNNITAVSRNNKLYEYMSCTTAVIASDFPLWKEFIEKNKCGICVDPLSPKEIAKAIDYLIEHPDEAKKMGENGRKAVLEKYNWENESKKLLNIYEELSK